jgi:predicted small secreted protein
MNSLLTIFVVVALVSVSILSSSCSTAVGLGKDLQSLGQALENVAR